MLQLIKGNLCGFFVDAYYMVWIFYLDFTVSFKSTHAKLDSSVILFLNVFFIKFISHAYFDENIDKVAFANIFKQSKVLGIPFHMVRISSSVL